MIYNGLLTLWKAKTKQLSGRVLTFGDMDLYRLTSLSDTRDQSEKMMPTSYYSLCLMSRANCSQQPGNIVWAHLGQWSEHDGDQNAKTVFSLLVLLYLPILNLYFL